MTADATPESGVLGHLPAVYRTLAPELERLPRSGEARSDCGNCVMSPAVSGEPEDSPWAFHPEARCCTFHPSLANFLVGRALRLGDPAASLVRHRMRSGLGVTAWGIRPPAGWLQHYERVAHNGFGRDLSLRCPYWVGGQFSCGIWEARPATCRTWFCKHQDGKQGGVLWAQVRSVLARAGAVLAEYCIHSGTPPEPLADGATSMSDSQLDAWLAWYEQCAALIDGVTDDADGQHGHDIDRFLAERDDDAGLAAARTDLVHLLDRPPRVLPAVVTPAVREVTHEARGIRVSAYSHYDTVIAPHTLFRFLSRLDGQRTWRAARDEAAHAYDDAGPDSAISDDTVAELYRIGALETPGETDASVLVRSPWPGLDESSDG